jgi:hypothetical protein
MAYTCMRVLLVTKFSSDGISAEYWTDFLYGWKYFSSKKASPTRGENIAVFPIRFPSDLDLSTVNVAHLISVLDKIVSQYQHLLRNNLVMWDEKVVRDGQPKITRRNVDLKFRSVSVGYADFNRQIRHPTSGFYLEDS